MDYNLFLDSDVILDVVLQREGFYEHSFPLFKIREERAALLHTSSSVIMNVQYISTTFIGKNRATEGIKYLLNFLEIQDCNKQVIVKAYNTICRDVEDAVQYFTAINSGMPNFFITRNLKDYRDIEDKSLPVLTPTQFLKLFKQNP